jgi:RNA polymerase sigma-70 factor (ECF subfamily)
MERPAGGTSGVDVRRLEVLVRLHQAEVYRYVRYLGADPASAEDLVQETFLAAFADPRPLADGDERRRAAWLRGIARNKYLMHCRGRRSRPLPVASAILERLEATWSSEFLRDGDGFEYLEALRRCLDALPGKQRLAVDLQYAQGRSRTEMAQLLRMTSDGVKSLMRRVRRALGECVEKRLGVQS